MWQTSCFFGIKGKSPLHRHTIDVAPVVAGGGRSVHGAETIAGVSGSLLEPIESAYSERESGALISTNLAKYSNAE